MPDDVTGLRGVPQRAGRLGLVAGDTSRTLAQYAHDTKSLVQDADDDLAGKAEGKG